MFSEELIKEFKEDGLTDEEIELLEDTFSLSQTIDMLPDNVESFIREYEQKVPSGKNNGVREFFELAYKDPEFFQKMIAFDIAMAQELENAPEEPQNRTVITELPEGDYKKASENYFKILASLSESDRAEFLKLVSEITPEQKRDMVSRLLNQ